MLYALGGEGFFNVCRLLVVVLLARLTSPEVLGQFDYALALSAPVVLFCTLQLKAAYVSDAADTSPFGAYRALRSCGLLAAGAVLGGLCVWSFFSEPQPVFALILLAVSLSKLAHAAAEVYWGVFQRRERIDLAARSSLLRGGAMLLAVGTLLPLWAALSASANARAWITAGAICTYALAWWLVLWLYDRPSALRLGPLEPRWTWPQVAALLKQTLPLGGILLIISLYESLPRYFVEARPNGKALLGYFGALNYIALASSLVLTQVCVASASRVARYSQRDRPAFVRLAGKLLALALALGATLICATWLGGAWFLRTLYQPDYARYAEQFLLLIVGQAFVLLANVLGFLVTHMRMFWIQVPIQCAVLATTFVAAQVFIATTTTDSDAVRGGALTVLVRAVTQAALLAVCVLVGLRRPTALAGSPSVR